MAAVWIILALFCVTGSLGQTVYWPRCGGTEATAQLWTVDYNAKSQEIWPIDVQANWNYNTDITQENQDAMVGADSIEYTFNLMIDHF